MKLYIKVHPKPVLVIVDSALTPEDMNPIHEIGARRRAIFEAFGYNFTIGLTDKQIMEITTIKEKR